MTRLDRRFEQLDRVQAPELWADIVDRATASVDAAATVRVPRGGRLGSPWPRPRTAIWIASLALLLLALLAVMLAGTQPARPGPLVFLAGQPFGGTSGDLFAVRAGGQPVRIAAQVTHRFHQSPDGRHVLAQRDDAVVLARVDGSPDRILAANGRVGREWERPWAPDSRRVAFVDGYDLVIADAEHGIVTRRIGLPAATVYGLYWSPDGAAILVQLNGRGDVFAVPEGPLGERAALLVSVESGLVTEIDSRLHLATAPVWSPDGARIAGVRDQGVDGASLVVIDARSREITELVTRVEVAEVTWSADGALIRWGSQVRGEAVILEVPSTGGDPRVVVEGIADGSWSPDRRVIAWLTLANRTDSSSGELWILDIETGARRRLADDVQASGRIPRPLWSADGAWLAVERGAADHPTGRAASTEPAATLWLVAVDGSGEQRLSEMPGGKALSGVDWSTP